MKKLFSFTTRKGVFYVCAKGEYFYPGFEDESLGAYASPQMAAYELANGHTFWPSCGDPSLLDIPESLDHWERL